MQRTWSVHKQQTRGAHHHVVRLGFLRHMAAGVAHLEVEQEASNGEGRAADAEPDVVLQQEGGGTTGSQPLNRLDFTVRSCG